MAENPSTVEIRCVTLDGDIIDLTPYVMFNSASFEFQANAVPGGFDLTLVDRNNELVFGSVSNNYAGINTGATIYLFIDGQKQYGGILMQVERQYAFPVVDTSVLADVEARQFVLRGMDFNIWFDKRVLRDTNDYKRGIIIPGHHYDGYIIRSLLPDYIDVPPGVTFPSSTIENIEEFGYKYNPDGTVNKVTGWKPGAQGDPWRGAMERLARRSAAVWYIDEEKRVNFWSLESALSPFNFTDHNPTDPAIDWITLDGKPRVGCRQVRATQDGAPIVTDALVWGGLEQLADGTGNNGDGIFFARYPSGAVDGELEQRAVDARNRWGRWQYAEVNFSQGDDQISVEHRARAIVMGPPGNAGGVELGLHAPIWSINLTWFAHDVQGTFIRPGQVATIMLYAMGHENDAGQWVPLVQSLPLRSVRITFPQIPEVNAGQYKTWVQFEGDFGINYSDTRQLWKFILRQNRRNTAKSAGDYEAAGVVTAASTYAGFNADGHFYFTGDGTTTVFNVQRDGPTNQPYIGGTTRVYINGLRMRPGFEYTESDPGSGEITFTSAPLEDDYIYVELRAAGV